MSNLFPPNGLCCNSIYREMRCLIVIDRQVRKIYTTPRSRSEYEQDPLQKTKLFDCMEHNPYSEVDRRSAGHEIIILNGTQKPSSETDSSLYIQALCIEDSS
jgi:hypothetical protein